jgi:hypothetical protein
MALAVVALPASSQVVPSKLWWCRAPSFMWFLPGAVNTYVRSKCCWDYCCVCGYENRSYE